MIAVFGIISPMYRHCRNHKAIRKSLSRLKPTNTVPSVLKRQTLFNIILVYSRCLSLNRNMAALVQHPGELSLKKLLATLTTTLHAPIYVFAVVKADAKLPPFSKVQMLFREDGAEGVTAILTREDAEAHQVEYSFPCKKITLNVMSSLEAVGFIAVIATRLAKYEMGVNPVSGFYHDHLFVPLGRENDAIQILADLAEESAMAAEIQ